MPGLTTIVYDPGRGLRLAGEVSEVQTPEGPLSVRPCLYGQIPSVYLGFGPGLNLQVHPSTLVWTPDDIWVSAHTLREGSIVSRPRLEYQPLPPPDNKVLRAAAWVWGYHLADKGPLVSPLVVDKALEVYGLPDEPKVRAALWAHSTPNQNPYEHPLNDQSLYIDVALGLTFRGVGKRETKIRMWHDNMARYSFIRQLVMQVRGSTHFEGEYMWVRPGPVLRALTGAEHLHEWKAPTRHTVTFVEEGIEPVIHLSTEPYIVGPCLIREPHP